MSQLPLPTDLILPPEVIAWAMKAFIRSLQGQCQGSTRYPAKTLEGILDHMTDWLDLTAEEREQVRIYLTNAAVQQRTNFPRNT